MAVDPIPPGFHSITPYFRVKGADGFIAFVEKAFGGELKHRHPTPDGKVMHAAMQIGNSMIELSDGKEEWPALPFAIHFYTPDADAMYQKALDEGATSLYEPTDHPYGERGAGVRDAWGNEWFIATRTSETY